MSSSQGIGSSFDVIVVGGGPAGSTASLLLARAGFRVAVVEKTAFPRFQLGESFLVKNYEILQQLGLAERLDKVPHTDKLGAEIAFGDAGDSTLIGFDSGFSEGDNWTFNAARADLDAMLLEAAREEGVTVFQPASVERIRKLSDGDVQVQLPDRVLNGKWLLDGSGQTTLVARHLGSRRRLRGRHLQKVAYFEHFEGVERLSGDRQGFPTIMMAEEGWFWIIPLNERTTSVGLVIDPAVTRAAGVPADRMLQWGISRCPNMRSRMGGASGPDRNRIRADYSYRCRPSAGPGYFLLGDAAAFLDPVFSSGVCLAMASAVAASELVVKILRGELSPRRARLRYRRRLRTQRRELFSMIRKYYDHSFREVLLSGYGPLDVHRAVLDVLAGHGVTRVRWSMWWRLRLFGCIVFLQRFLPLAPRRGRFSLLASDPPPPTR